MLIIVKYSSILFILLFFSFLGSVVSAAVVFRFLRTLLFAYHIWTSSIDSTNCSWSWGGVALQLRQL